MYENESRSPFSSLWAAMSSRKLGSSAVDPPKVTNDIELFNSRDEYGTSLHDRTAAANCILNVILNIQHASKPSGPDMRVVNEICRVL